MSRAAPKGAAFCLTICGFVEGEKLGRENDANMVSCTPQQNSV